MRVLDTIDETLIESLATRDEFFWLDLADPSEDDVARLARRFAWHELVIHDLVNFGQRPKIDTYGDYMLLVFYGARASPDDVPELTEVHLVVSGSYIVTLRRAKCD